VGEVDSGRQGAGTGRRRFNDPADPLKIIIVTAKLLTGFDAPILQTQYLDKPLKEHTLLQAITRTNRVYPPNKTHGLIVDYLGIFDDVAKSLAFDETAVAAGDLQHRGTEEAARTGHGDRARVLPRRRPHHRWLRGAHPSTGRDRPDTVKDAFGSGVQRDLAVVGGAQPRPDAFKQYREDYKWLTDVYESVRPADITGRLVWHALGAKTIELINEHVEVEVPQTAETIVLDAQTIEDLMTGKRKDMPN
jgi:type I restriction enzyme R subunit